MTNTFWRIRDHNEEKQQQQLMKTYKNAEEKLIRVVPHFFCVLASSLERALLELLTTPTRAMPCLLTLLAYLVFFICIQYDNMRLVKPNRKKKLNRRITIKRAS